MAAMVPIRVVLHIGGRMPTSRQAGTGNDDILPSQRSKTQFTKAYKDRFKAYKDRFNEGIVGLGKVDMTIIYTTMTRFERAYQSSTSHISIAGGFHTDHLGSVSGCYQLYEVYAGLNYRVAVMFLQRRPLAYWLYPWRKTGRRNPKAINTAKSIASDKWAELERQERGQHHG
jgi:hypothetical protein